MQHGIYWITFKEGRIVTNHQFEGLSSGSAQRIGLVLDIGLQEG